METLRMTSKEMDRRCPNHIRPRILPEGGRIVMSNGVVINYGKNLFIGSNVQIGSTNIQRPRKSYKKEVTIGDDCIILDGAIIYSGVVLGDRVRINHYTVIRENTTIGSDTSIGAFSYCEGNTKIGSNCSIYTHAHLTINMVIGDNVFAAPFLNTMSDPRMGYRRPLIQDHEGERGPVIGNNVRISSNVSIQPGVFIGNEAVIGTGALVTKNVKPAVVVFGVPAKEIKAVPSDQFIPDGKGNMKFDVNMDDDTWVKEFEKWAETR